METLYPLCFNESLTEDQIQNYECSDGIYVSANRFRLFMTDGDDSLIIISLKRGDRCAYTYIRGTHTGLDEVVYAPSWICQVLDVEGGETIELEKAHPSLGSTITIKPHTSQYSLLDDPVSELRNAFENYSCLSAGVDIPLMVSGEVIIVSIIETGSKEPVCIRGIELEVKIETPLDKEAEEALAAEEEALAASAAAAAERALAAAAAKPPDNRFPGRGYRLDGKNID